MMDPAYNNTNRFQATGDETTWLTPETTVKLAQTGVTQSGIQSVVYSGGETIVTLHDAVVLADLSAVTTVGAVGLENGLSTHQHNRNPGSGGLVGMNRMIMAYVSTTAITIGSGHYYIENAAGDKSFTFWSEADISYTFTSLGASQLQYLYADFSVIEDMDWWEVDATCFYNSTTAPTWSDARKGWYNGDDLCVWGIPTNSSSHIRIFAQNNRLIQYQDVVNYDIASAASPGTTWTDYTATAPAFVRLAVVWAMVLKASGYAGTGTLLYVRENGLSSTGYTVLQRFDEQLANMSFDCAVDSSQIFEAQVSTATGDVIYLTTLGYHLSEGM